MIGLLISTLLASEPEERSVVSGWLQVDPVGFAIPSPGGHDVAQMNRAIRWGYRWGFSVGASFEPVRHLFINATVGFAQTVWIFRNVEPAGYLVCFGGDCYGWDERGVGHLIRVGPKLRLGWTSERVIAWALWSGQLGISRLRLDCNNSVEDHCDRTATDVGAGFGGGVGVGVRATPRIAIGLEGSVDHVWLEQRDDPFRAVRTIDLALLVAFIF